MSSEESILRSDFEDRLAQVVDATGLSNAEFARKIGASPGFIGNILKGRRAPSKKTIMLICSTFSVDEHWLMTGEGGMFRNDLWVPIVRGVPSLSNSENMAKVDSENTTAVILDERVMHSAIEAVETVLAAQSMHVDPSKKADLVLLLYKVSIENRRVDLALAVNLVALAV